MNRKKLNVVVGFVLLLLATFSACRDMSHESYYSTLLPVGAPLPEITAEGWINEPAPTADDLRGQVVVVDVWAHWCHPCRAAMPEMVALHGKYINQGVRFIGLTSVDSKEFDDTQAAIDHDKITWPNGYGAGQTIQALGVQAIPSVFVVGRDGRIIWHSGRPGTVAEAITSALEKS